MMVNAPARTPHASVFDERNQTLVLVASSNDAFRQEVMRRLSTCGCPGLEADGGADALAKLERQPCEALLLDRCLHDLDAEEVAGLAKAGHPALSVFLLDSAAARFAPNEPRPMTPAIRRIIQALANPPASDSEPLPPEAEPEACPVVPGAVEPLPAMIGESKPMHDVYRLARLVVPRDTTVLITGETGTGKELVARAIHHLGPRASGPFVVVNCAAIPDTLLEAELFGYTRGAFTGAFQNRVGRIHSAHGGTLFLDEVSELPPAMQAKLLRFLQEGEVQRLGSPDVFRVDVRVIAATNARLAERVTQRQFREDLLYRIAVFPIEMPPLREHKEDIRALAEDCLARLCRDAQIPPKQMTPGALRLLHSHTWPGNVRELLNVLERAFILAGEERSLLPAHLPMLLG